MKKKIMMFMLISVNIILCQNVDLILKTNITQDYINYLNNELVNCNQIIQAPSSNAEAIKAHAKRIFVNISLINCDFDNLQKKINPIIETMNDNNLKLDNFYNMNLANLNFGSDDHFFDNLMKLFKEPVYSQIKDEIKGMSGNYQAIVTDISSNEIELSKSTSTKIQQIKDDLNVLKNSTIPFTLKIQIISPEFNNTIVLSDAHFKELSSISDLCDKTSNSLNLAFNQFHELQNREVQASVMITSIKNSISYFTSALNTLSDLLNTDPISKFKMNTVWIHNLNNSLNEVTLLLNGKIYYLGDEKIKFRPVTLLEYSIADLGKIIMDFYRTANRYNYTFAGLFPEALRATLVDQLKEDMIINLSDNETAVTSRIIELKKMFLAQLVLKPTDTSLNFGVALTQSYLYMNELNKEIKDFVNYLKAGDYKKKFQFTVVKNKALSDSISNYFRKSKDYQKLSFTLLMITTKQGQPYTINTSTEFVPVFITNSIIDNIRQITNDIMEPVYDIADSFSDIYDDLDNMFNMNLDPNNLDFSYVKTPHDLILALEKSNPNFLEITSYGITKMKNTGSDIRKSFSTYAKGMNNIKNYVDSSTVVNDDLKSSGKDTKLFISDMNDFVQEVNTDFQKPDSATVINNEKVNLSAWFDNPPQHLLTKLKCFFDGNKTTDKTLGGLFPNKKSTSIVTNNSQIPTSYSISQNYPNPFNPTTTISFSIPKSCFVTLNIYDLLGREIATLVNEDKTMGSYEVKFDASFITSGIYFYQLRTDEFIETKKMIFMK